MVLRELDAGHPPARRSPCLDTDVLAALASASLSPGLRPEALGHVAECPDCRAAVSSLARALANPDVSRAMASLAGTTTVGSRRLIRFVLPAAAAALFVAIWAGGNTPPEPRHRAPAITAADNPEPIAPLGPEQRADALRWTAVPGVDRYRVTLFDAVGRVLFEAELQDTLVMLPRTVELLPGRAYFWKVEGRTGWDRWSASPLLEFSVEGRTP